MATLSPVLHPLPSMVNGVESHLLESRRVEPEMVCNEMARSKALLLQKLAHQFLGSSYPGGTGPGSQDPRAQRRQLAIVTSTSRQWRRTSRPDATVHVGETG